MPKQYYTLKHYQSQRSVGHLMRRAGKLITAQIESLFVKADVSFVQWVILMHLRDDVRMTAAELSQHLCHDSGALTRVIDQMEKRKLIIRKRSTTDRRRVALALTKEGHKVIKLYLPRVIDLYNGLLTDFSQKETDTMIDLVSRFIAKLSSNLPLTGES